jgi:hypothetical protein
VFHAILGGESAHVKGGIERKRATNRNPVRIGVLIFDVVFIFSVVVE